MKVPFIAVSLFSAIIVAVAEVCLSPSSGVVEISKVASSYDDYAVGPITFDGEVVELMSTSESVKVSGAGIYRFKFASVAANEGEYIKFRDELQKASVILRTGSKP